MKNLFLGIIIAIIAIILVGCDLEIPGSKRDKPIYMDNVEHSIKYVCVNDILYFMAKANGNGVISPLYSKTGDGSIEKCDATSSYY